MGGVSEDQETAPTLAADVELLPARVMLDDASRWSRALDGDLAKEAVVLVDNENEDPDLVGICQICMDVVPKRQVVTRVCGAECLAEVCAQCLVQHVIATVYSFYPGVLPKVRCPICLTLLNKRQWRCFAVPSLKEDDKGEEEETAETEPAVDEQGGGAGENQGDDATSAAATSEDSDARDAESQSAGRESDSTATADSEFDSSEDSGISETAPDTSDTAAADAQQAQQPADEWVDDNAHVLEKYETLCRQSCGFQSPCCHDTDYTMLPPTPARKQAAAVVALLAPEQQAALPELLSLLRAFCFHREETAVLYDRMTALFAARTADMLTLLLPRITDEERRATLLLHHLFLHPNAVTRCCGEPVCFKCKASDHHDGDCNDFVEEESVLECRGCHVTLVKVDGCDTVACLCGYSFSWQAEVDQRRTQRRQLAPAGDREFAQWRHWHRRLASSFGEIGSVNETMRQMRLARMLRDHRALLQRVLLARILRKRQAMKKQLTADASDAVVVESNAEPGAP